MKTLIEIIQEKIDQDYHKLLKWQKENPGYIMNNYDIRLMDGRRLLKKHDITIDDIKILSKASSLLGQMTSTIHGHYVSYLFYEEIIDEYEIQNLGEC